MLCPRDGSWRAWKLPGERPRTYSVWVDPSDKVWLTDFAANAVVRFDPKQTPRSGSTVQVIEARSLQGRFAQVTVAAAGWKAQQVFTAHGVSVRVTKG